jgi:hypothetical protein
VPVRARPGAYWGRSSQTAMEEILGTGSAPTRAYRGPRLPFIRVRWQSPIVIKPSAFALIGS